jgi:TonB family protein
MNALEGWMLGYLLNSLWQVPVLFAAAWMVSRMARRMGPRAEHRVWVSALLLEAILPACSLRLDGLLHAAWTLWHRGPGAAGGMVGVTMGAGAVSGTGVLRLPGRALMGIAIAYGCGLVYFAARLAWGLWRTEAMRRQAKPVTLTGAMGLQWDRYRRMFGVETAEVALSSHTAGPVTVGIRRGVMLVPPGFLESVAEDDLTAVMAHELAHMRRRDFAKNIVYGFVTLTVAYHPVAWLTRARVAATREMVCDAMAAEAVAGREQYAHSLLRLASLLAKGTPKRTLHAIGIFDANIFERRVMKLTEKRVEMKGVRRIVVAVACVMLGVGTCASAMALRMEVAQEAAPAPLTIPTGTSEGNILYKKSPVYPVEAKVNKDTIDGVVLLTVTIGKDGSVEHVVVKRSLRADYDQSAIDAVKEWRFKPFLMNGQPAEVNKMLQVAFSIK